MQLFRLFSRPWEKRCGVSQDRHKALSLQDEEVILDQDRHKALSLQDDTASSKCLAALFSIGWQQVGTELCEIALKM